MRTRGSARNQQILWRALTPPAPEKPAPVQGQNRCWDCISYPKGGRSRGECILKGDMVNGRSESRPCWRAR